MKRHHEVDVYLNSNDKRIAKKTTIKRPFWKGTIGCYKQILLFCNLSEADYPCIIGPYYNPLHMISYIESTFQLTKIFYLFLRCCKNKKHFICVYYYL